MTSKAPLPAPAAPPTLPLAPPPAPPPALRVAFIDWFGLSPCEADVLAVLFAARGACLNAPRLAAAAGSTPGAISVHLVQVRRALEAEAVDHVPGAGYCLTPEGLAECRDAVRAVAEELGAAAEAS
ncbi:hypothetical protein ACO2Q3_12145 [Caulobacter sp. KR2-114]|uniref:hypothetical protein n=1 Tax=Caulobacter sp. KR2-114 TaxID=3400912 RepID=UPI003BFAA061